MIEDDQERMNRNWEREQRNRSMDRFEEMTRSELIMAARKVTAVANEIHGTPKPGEKPDTLLQ